MVIEAVGEVEVENDEVASPLVGALDGIGVCLHAVWNIIDGQLC